MTDATGTENATRQHKTPSAFLRCARAIISKGWAQGWFAKDAAGFYVNPEHPRAVTFCMLGAMQKCAAGQEDRWVYHKARDLLTSVTPKRHVPDFNDAPKRTKKQVLERFDLAIAKATKVRK